MTTKWTYAAALAAAMLSVPALAAEPVNSFTRDPTWPADFEPAPGIALSGSGSDASVLTDPTWPAVPAAAPAVALAPQPAKRAPAVRATPICRCSLATSR